MKKIITLCFFAFSILFNVQSLDAQNLIDINKEASAKAKELTKTIKFNNNKIEDVYQAFKTYETTYQKISSDLSNNKELLDKINLVLDNSLEEIFTEEEFQRYITKYRSNQEVTN